MYVQLKQNYVFHSVLLLNINSSNRYLFSNKSASAFRNRVVPSAKVVTPDSCWSDHIVSTVTSVSDGAARSKVVYGMLSSNVTVSERRQRISASLAAKSWRATISSAIRYLTIPLTVGHAVDGCLSLKSISRVAFESDSSSWGEVEACTIGNWFSLTVDISIGWENRHPTDSLWWWWCWGYNITPASWWRIVPLTI